MRRLVWIMWPSFLLAIPASGVYFSLFDPVDIEVLGVHIAGQRLAAYTFGFLAFWLLGACSSALSLWLARDGREPDAP